MKDKKFDKIQEPNLCQMYTIQLLLVCRQFLLLSQLPSLDLLQLFHIHREIDR